MPVDGRVDTSEVAGLLLLVLLTCLTLSCSGRNGQQASESPGQSPSASSSTREIAGDPAADSGEWPMPTKDYANSRYSGLNQINTENAKNLKLAWMFSTGVLRGHEAAPIVVKNMMYIITPFPNIVYALDLTQPGGALKWVYKPQPDAASQGVACCDVVNRGVNYSNGKIFLNTLDDHTIALDANTGKVLWNRQLGDINKGESMTMAPFVVKDKVLVGNSGGEFGVRGWITALDANTGKTAWRGYSAGPDKDVLIGSNFKPHYASARGKDLGVSTWPPGLWKIGGGSVWGWISYDPELDLIYYGTSNPGPWNAAQRPGDNKWTCTLFARRPETGDVIWAYQMNPHDDDDYDGVNENVLLNLPIQGQTRKVLVHPDRNGRMYVIDRATGQVLSANPFVYVNTSTGVNLETGKLEKNPAKETSVGTTVRDVCPAATGGKDWQPSAFSPHTNWIYVPHNNLCMDFEGVQANYIAGTPFVGADVKFIPGPGGNRGAFTAWDPVAGKAVWSIQERFPVWSGAVATAGDVVFYGTMDRWFKAVNARTGQLLWKFRTGSGVIGQPVTYLGPDHKQYVAVLAGVGGWSGAIVAGQLNGRDGTGALGFVNAMTDLPNYTNRGGMLYVFSLP